MKIERQRFRIDLIVTVKEFVVVVVFNNNR